MASLAWPVWPLILSVETPAYAGGEAGAQAVAGEVGRVHAGGGVARTISDRQGVRQPPRLMRFRDRGNAADERGHAEGLRVCGYVGGHERRLGGQRAARGGEMGEVRPIGPSGVVGDARFDQGSDFVRSRNAS